MKQKIEKILEGMTDILPSLNWSANHSADWPGDQEVELLTKLSGFLNLLAESISSSEDQGLTDMQFDLAFLADQCNDIIDFYQQNEDVGVEVEEKQETQTPSYYTIYDTTNYTQYDTTSYTTTTYADEDATISWDTIPG